ncbi:MAG: hypothetical protein LBP82_00665 [Candidatus Methanoplasma sp.]|jgi:predicted RNA binding protein with dsRBD fold (UPF0201 family)|nr:hypothetical protein [Candidatus Methanoplasma sp.]
MVMVWISCKVYPSEDKEKVRKAILNLFPDASLDDTDLGFEGEAGADRFCDLVRKQKILDSTRSTMFKGIRGRAIILHLNKQVAAVGKVSFTDPATILGTLQVTIDAGDPETVIDRIAPRTVDGEEVKVC